MLPLLELKSYTRYVVQYLVELTSRSYKTPLTKEQCFLVLSVVHSKTKHFPADLQKKLVENLPIVRDWVINNSSSCLKAWVEPFLKKIASTPNQAHQNSLCYLLMAIFVHNDSTLSDWLRVYSKNLPASTVLFNYIRKWRKYTTDHQNQRYLFRFQLTITTRFLRRLKRTWSLCWRTVRELIGSWR